MAIDPENTDAVSIIQLDPLTPLSIATYLVGCNADGKMGNFTAEQLANIIAPYVSALGASPFVANTGSPLPNPIEKPTAITFVGIGDFDQTTGSNVVTTEELNVLFWSSNGVTGTWILGVAIPIVLTDYVSKTDVLYKTGKNLFNKATIVADHYLNKDNIEFANITYCYSDFIEVESGATYYGKSDIGGVAPGLRYVTFFNASKVNINTGSNTHSLTTTIPASGVKYIKISITQTGLNTFQLEKGIAQTAYEPYSQFLKSVIGYPVKDNYTKSELDAILDAKATEEFVNESIYSVFNSLPSVLVSGSNAAVSLANNKPAPNDGVIDKVTVLSPSNGNALFQVIERRTFIYPTPAAGQKETFAGGITFVVAVTAGVHEYDVPNIPIKAGEFLQQIGDTGYVNPTFDTTVLTGWWQGLSDPITSPALLTFQVGTAGFSFSVTSDKFVTQEQFNQTPNINWIIATRNADDFNSIRDIIKGITDATDTNLYKILVPYGSWFEFDLQGKKHVEIVGMSRDECILYCDSTLTTAKYIAPADFSYPTDIGVQINAISPERMNVIYINDDIICSNITISLNRGKYPVHLDNVSYSKAQFNNVRLKEIADTNYPLGIGIFGNQVIEFIDCIFERAIATSKQLGIFIHNWNNQSAPSNFSVINSKFINCGYGMIDELGSDQPDRFDFINCQTNSIGEFSFMVGRTGDTTYWTNPTTGVKEPNPQAVPYSIQLNCSGTKVDLITGRATFPSPYAGLVERPEVYTHVISDYVGYATLAINETITKGDLISNSIANMSNQNLCQKHTGDMPILGVALDTVTGIGQPIKYVPKGKYAMLNVNGAVGTGTSRKLIFDPLDDTVKPSASADINDIIGYSIESKGAGRVDSTCFIIDK